MWICLYFIKKWEFLNDKIALKESKNVSLKLEAEYQTDKKQSERTKQYYQRNDSPTQPSLNCFITVVSFKPK